MIYELCYDFWIWLMPSMTFRQLKLQYFVDLVLCTFSLSMYCWSALVTGLPPLYTLCLYVCISFIPGCNGYCIYCCSVDDGFPAVTFYFENGLSLKVYPHDYLFLSVSILQVYLIFLLLWYMRVLFGLFLDLLLSAFCRYLLFMPHFGYPFLKYSV